MSMPRKQNQLEQRGIGVLKTVYDKTRRDKVNHEKMLNEHEPKAKNK